MDALFVESALGEDAYESEDFARVRKRWICWGFRIVVSRCGAVDFLLQRLTFDITYQLVIHVFWWLQLTSAEFDVMSCGENISEAGPTTAANIDNLNNIPRKFYSQPNGRKYE